MTSIFSGQLYRRLVTDQNQLRLETYDVNRFQRTITQQSGQQRREKELREGLETHQAIMADLQTRLNELTEKLNNVYRRFIENQASFLKISDTHPYSNTSGLLNSLRSVTDGTGPTESGYPAGSAGILPFDDPNRVKNYTYNPYFGSKALDMSDQLVMRTLYQEAGASYENAYRENGAFWSTISYLWGWDLDRINATYATTNNNLPLVGANGETTNNLQVNVTAIQPNREASPPVRTGDRFSIKSSATTASAPYPSIVIDGIRPGGVDFNHATVTPGVNEVGQDSVSWGWEFDDLPLALEVTGVTVLPDGSTQASGYKVVYDIKGNIPPTDPDYARLILLDGTEPQILDAPTELTKVRINQSELTYSGFTELGDMPLFSGNYETPFELFGGTGNRTATTVSAHPKDFQSEEIAHYDFVSCNPLVVDANLRLSFDYRFIMQQNAQTGSYASPGDDGFVPPYNSHNWSNAGDGILNPGSFSQMLDQPVQVGDINGDGVNEFYMLLGQVATSPADRVGFDDPFHSGSGFTPGGVSEVITGANLGNGGTGSGPVRLTSTAGLTLGSTVRFGSNPGDPVRTITNIQGDYVYLDSALPTTPGGGVVQSPPGTTVTTVDSANSGSGLAGALQVNDAATFTVGETVTVYDGSGVNRGSYTIASIDTSNNTLTFTTPVMSGSTPVILSNGRVEKPPVGGTVGGGVTESVMLTFEQTDANTMRVGVVIDGDIHHFEIEIQNLKIVSYSGDTGSWQQGLYNSAAPALGNGDLPITGDPNDVINKYETDKYNFTQFMGEYDNPATTAGSLALNLNDILRSPYEYAKFNIGTGSQLSGEMFIDLNDRRLNLELEDYDNALTQPDWSPTATTLSPDFLTGANVAKVYDFNTPDNPEDECIPESSAHPAADREGTAADSDPYTYGDRLNDAGNNPISTTPADPLRSSDIGASTPVPTGYYAGMAGGASNDVTGTIDRVAGTSGMSYTIAIPTTDLNVLKKENDLVINFGSLADRDYGIHIEEPYLEYRVVPDYTTVPRYRVDASGNIYDRFGNGSYNASNPRDQAALTDLYTTRQINTPVSTDPLINGQVSNHDGIYQNGSGDTMSPDGDDYNLFDYIPDLRDDPNNPDPNVLRGERYVGSLPTNFYYYREALDKGAGSNGLPTNGASTGDKRPSLNFDGRGTNTNGQYNSAHTTVYNTEMPSFANVMLGYTEQKAVLNNGAGHTSFAAWQGFMGLGGRTSAAQVILHPNPPDNTVINPYAALGYSRPGTTEAGAEIRSGHDLQLEMFSDSSEMGHLLVYETYASPDHAPQIQSAGVIGPSGNGQTSDVTLDNVAFMNVGDVLYYDDGSGYPRRKVVTSVTVTGPGNQGTIRFAENLPYPGDNSPPESNLTGGVFSKYTPVLKTAAHAIPLPLEPGYEFSFNSYAARKTMTRTGSETRNGITYLHVDSGLAFKNPPPPTMDITVNGQTRTIRPQDVNTSTHPHVIMLQPPLADPLPGNDSPVVMTAGEFTVRIDDGALANSKISLSYNDQGTTLPGLIASVELSPEMDRVGRTIGDDARTAAGETGAVAPEYFADQPPGFIEPDARLDLNLVARDVDGNQQPRRLKEVRVTIESGEQVILGADGKIRQEYSSNDQDSIIGTTEGNLLLSSGTWPIALFDEHDNPINLTGTSDLGILVGYFQGITAATADSISVTDSSEFKLGDTVTINGESRKISGITGNTLSLDNPMATVPRFGDKVSLGTGDGTRSIKAYLNRSFAMSTNAPVKIDLIWEDYEVTGYPPTAARAGNEVPETIGYSTTSPADAPPSDAYLGANYLVVGDGRGGGSSANEFTLELKRILDNPEYSEIFRHNLVRNVFITATINDSFNDQISSKLMLEYDRQQRRVELQQTAYSAYYKSI